MSECDAAKQSSGWVVSGWLATLAPASMRRMCREGLRACRREARVQPARPPPMIMMSADLGMVAMVV